MKRVQSNSLINNIENVQLRSNNNNTSSLKRNSKNKESDVKTMYDILTNRNSTFGFIYGHKKSLSTTRIQTYGLNNEYFNEKIQFNSLHQKNYNGSGLQTPNIKSKTNTLKSQDLLITMDKLFEEKHNSNDSSPCRSPIEGTHDDGFEKDNLPTSLSEQWISNYHGSTNTVSKHAKLQLASIHEFLTTELNFLNQMQYLLDISSKVVSNLQNQILRTVKIEEIFLNVGDIYEANYAFWSQYLYASYKEAVENKDKIHVSKWKEGFKNIDTMFAPYQSYCGRISSSKKQIQNLEKTNKYFAKFLHWFSSKVPANRESLCDFIVKPFQRLTKYELLLNSILKYSSDDDEKEDLKEMIRSVNDFMKVAQQKMIVAGISSRLDPIDFVEVPSDDIEKMCSSYRTLDLCRQIQIGANSMQRDHISDLNLKLKDAHVKAIEVTCMTFNDLILICQRIKNLGTDPIKIIRPIIPIQRIKIKELSHGSVLIRVLSEYETLENVYVLSGEANSISNWIQKILELKEKLEILCTQAFNTSPELIITPNLQVTCPTPQPGRSPSPEPAPITVIATPVKKNEIINLTNKVYLNREHQINNSFMRSNVLSSPIVRRRNTSENDEINNVKTQNRKTINAPLHQSESVDSHHNKSRSMIATNQKWPSKSYSKSTMNLYNLNEEIEPGVGRSQKNSIDLVDAPAPDKFFSCSDQPYTRNSFHSTAKLNEDSDVEEYKSATNTPQKILTFDLPPSQNPMEDNRELSSPAHMNHTSRSKSYDEPTVTEKFNVWSRSNSQPGPKESLVSTVATRSQSDPNKSTKNNIFLIDSRQVQSSTTLNE